MAFQFGDMVYIENTIIRGPIIGKAEYANYRQTQYLVEYINNDKEPDEDWFDEEKLSTI